MNRLKHHWSWLLALYVILVAFAYWQASRYFITNAEQQLEQHLQPKLAGIELYSMNDHEPKQYLAERINRDMRSLCATGSAWGYLRDCHGRVLAFNQDLFAEPLPAAEVLLTSQNSQLVLGLYHRTHWPQLLLTQLVLLVPLIAFVGWGPQAGNANQRRWATRLTKAGIRRSPIVRAMAALTHLPQPQRDCCEQWWQQSTIDAQALMSLLADNRFTHLNTDQLAWCDRALQSGKPVTQALSIAAHPNQLKFVPAKREVIVHGLHITLSGTPFFYYYWYALRRAAGIQQGWLINPATNSADTFHNRQLSLVIDQYGGHARASKDLLDKGLRAKTLDQNRSKIRDELCAALGDALSENFLFETERDPRTARYKYRLSLEPQCIVVASDDLQRLRSDAPNLAHSAA